MKMKILFVLFFLISSCATMMEDVRKVEKPDPELVRLKAEIYEANKNAMLIKADTQEKMKLIMYVISLLKSKQIDFPKLTKLINLLSKGMAVPEEKLVNSKIKHTDGSERELKSAIEFFAAEKDENRLPEIPNDLSKRKSKGHNYSQHVYDARLMLKTIQGVEKKLRKNLDKINIYLKILVVATKKKIENFEKKMNVTIQN